MDMTSRVDHRPSSNLHGQILLCPTRKEPARELVIAAWTAAGGRVIRLTSAWEAALRSQERVSCYGGVAFCKALADRLDADLPEPEPKLLSQIDPRWTRRAIEIRSIGSLSPSDFPAFLKSLDYELFPSAVYTSLEHLRTQCGTIPASTLALISEPVSLLAEARALFCRGLAVSLTPYWRATPRLPRGARPFLEDLLPHLVLLAACTVDIGLLSSGQWALVELNPIWAANPLGSDLGVFIQCLAAATLEKKPSSCRGLRQGKQEVRYGC